jgi:hypothetical protein
MQKKEVACSPGELRRGNLGALVALFVPYLSLSRRLLVFCRKSADLLSAKVQRRCTTSSTSSNTWDAVQRAWGPCTLNPGHSQSQP